MLTHFGKFLCSLGGKEPFKTDATLWSVALRSAFSFQQNSTYCISLSRYKSETSESSLSQLRYIKDVLIIRIQNMLEQDDLIRI